jgi:hypothetical protein
MWLFNIHHITDGKAMIKHNEVKGKVVPVLN